MIMDQTQAICTFEQRTYSYIHEHISEESNHITVTKNHAIEKNRNFQQQFIPLKLRKGESLDLKLGKGERERLRVLETKYNETRKS